MKRLLFVISIACAVFLPSYNAYSDTILVTNFRDNTVSVIDTSTNSVVRTIPGVGANPLCIAARPQGDFAYVTNYSVQALPSQPPTPPASGTTVTYLTNPTADTAAVGGTITVGNAPSGITITTDGNRAFVANRLSNTVSVIDTNTANLTTFNTVIQTITLDTENVAPTSITLSTDNTIAYVICSGYDTGTPGSIAVIDINTTSPTLYTQTDNITSLGSYAGNSPMEMAINGSTGFITLFTAASLNARVLRLNLSDNTVSNGSTYGNVSWLGCLSIAANSSSGEMYLSRMIGGDLDESGYDGDSNDYDFVQVLDSSGNSLASISLPAGRFDPRQIVFSGTYAYVTCFGQLASTPPQNTVEVINTNSGSRQVVQEITVGNSPYALCLIPSAIPPVLNIITTTLANGEQNLPYNEFVNATGGIPPYTYSYTGTLPQGLQLNASTGEIYGTPTVIDVYSFSITVTDSGSATDSQPLQIIVTEPIIPEISITPAYLTYSSNLGAGPPTPQKLYISNSGTGTLNWSVASNTPWIEMSPLAGASSGETDEVTISIDVTDLIVGTYSGTVTISDPEAVNNPVTVDVTLIINPTGTPPVIQVTPSSFTFYAAEGLANPSDGTLQIKNAGSGTLSWSVVDDVSWLTMDPPSGSSVGESDEITLSVSISGKAAGSYVANITLTAPGASNTPQTVPITLVIESPNSEINKYPTILYYTAIIGQENPDPQTVTLWNSRVVPLNWKITTNQTWITVTPAAGVGAKDEEVYLTISVDAADLEKGVYDGIATISDSNAINNPQYVFIKLTVALLNEVLKTPKLASPLDGTATEDSTPTFEWLPITDAGSVTYVLQMDEDITFASPVRYITGIASPTYTMDTLTNGTYYWRTMVMTSDAFAGEWSSPWSITIDAPDPTPVDTGGTTGGSNIGGDDTAGNGGNQSTSGGTSGQQLVPPASGKAACFIKNLLR